MSVNLPCAAIFYERALAVGDLRADGGFVTLPLDNEPSVPDDPVWVSALLQDSSRQDDSRAAQNLAIPLTDPSVGPVDVALGLAWCVIGAAGEQDLDTSAFYEGNCVSLGQRASGD